MTDLAKGPFVLSYTHRDSYTFLAIQCQKQALDLHARVLGLTLWGTDVTLLPTHYTQHEPRSLWDIEYRDGTNRRGFFQMWATEEESHFHCQKLRLNHQGRSKQ